MNPWFAKIIVLAASVAMVVIRAPHGRRSGAVPVAKRHRGPLEFVLLAIAWMAFFVPLIWIATSALAFADYPLHPVPLVIGSAMLIVGLWLFHRSHADLGTNWSISLDLREEHQLITRGIYRRVRHPMYSALLIYSIGQALVLPNWLAGPSYLVAMLLIIALRLPREERMMLDKFGGEYENYRAATK
ncbi:MAG TPA: protein-S-isoprenylcysteine O-methyltransferase, partial [Pirellulales bacterium]|nr:protein-S-isoprenylcysteine O-methyltransferase [Pirellulales bacterium]